MKPSGNTNSSNKLDHSQPGHSWTSPSVDWQQVPTVWQSCLRSAFQCVELLPAHRLLIILVECYFQTCGLLALRSQEHGKPRMCDQHTGHCATSSNIGVPPLCTDGLPARMCLTPCWQTTMPSHQPENLMQNLSKVSTDAAVSCEATLPCASTSSA